MKRTIDREQQQGRLGTEVHGTDSRAGRDLGWIVAISIVIVLAAFASHAFQRLVDWAGNLSGTDLNGLLALLVVVPIGAGVFAVRRYRDARSDRATLYRLSFHDPLTGLPNRRFLGDGFDQMLKQTRRVNGRIAVLFVDLDGFPEINVAHGPAVGDQVMIAVAARLVEACGPEDRAVRYGGDQFVLFCPEVSTAVSAERVAKRVLKAIEMPFEIGDSKVRISASVGVAITEERCTRPDEVLRDADAALFQAKLQGAGRYAMFDRAMRDQITPSTAERRLRLALENGEFRLYYQPIVSLWTKRLVAVEALLRWNEPSRGMVNPDEFMPALEETGLIVPIGAWVIEEVARQSQAWAEAFPDRPAINIKVNVSGRQLAQANFLTHLHSSLAKAGTDPARIYLEISESVLQSDAETMWSILREAKADGVALALDDFGTGYSSLSYLRQLKLDMLTVDKSFVDGLGFSREDTTIVEHVIGMAKALGIVTVAEGVETETQVERLRELNCDLAQGYYFSHPQPPYVITELLGRAGGRSEWRPPERTSEDGDGEAPPGLDAPVVVVDDSALTALPD
ncbi:MAG: putative bifunctional diguanylate cyclase/phosphodiesterase [Acidimicrobiales bacterium]